MLRRSSTVALITVASLLQLPSAHASEPEILIRDTSPETRDGRLLVRFSPKVPKQERQQAAEAADARISKRFSSVPGLVEMRAEDTASAIKELEQMEGVRYAEPDFIIKIDTPNDPQFSNLWGLHNTGQTLGTPDADIDAVEAWGTTTGTTAKVVGVIDTGVDFNHPDLLPNLFQAESNCSDLVDNDGNGYVDDCYGWNAINGTGNPFDDNSHGTHVSGTIGARGNNGIGITGVSQVTRISNCKFLNASGSGSTSDAIECFDYFADLFDNGVPLIATNNSWGGGGFSQALFDAILAQQARGIITVAAAGNDGTDNDAGPHYPSNYDLPSIISVAATDHDDLIADFSNFGKTTVDIGAPGVDILSTVPGNAYDSYDGTSMATPHVTGAIALLAASDPTLDDTGLFARTLLGADPIGSMTSTTSTGRRLNVNGAIGCSGVQRQRLEPPATVSLGVGGSLDVRLLSYSCTANAPSAPGTVGVSGPGGAGTISLLDDGLGADQAAGDGIFSGTFLGAVPGLHTLTFPGGATSQVSVLQGWNRAESPYFFRTGLPSSVNLGDDVAASVALPFDVTFGEEVFDTTTMGTLWFSSNAFVSFIDPVTDWVNVPPPFAGLPGAAAVFWDDLFRSGGTIRYGTLFSAPNREFVITWESNVKVGCGGSSSDRFTFQVIFPESGNGAVIMNYQDVSASSGSCGHRGASATVAVDGGGLSANLFSHNTASLTDMTTLVFSPLEPHQPDLSVAKVSSGPFRGDDVLNFTGTGQTMGKNGRRGVDKNFYIRLENEGPTEQEFIFAELARGGGLQARYFAGGSEVTSLVQAGLGITVPSGDTRTVRAVLRFTSVFPATTKRGVSLAAIFDPNGYFLPDLIRLQMTYR